MASGSGFITLHRKLLDSAVFDNPNDLKIWIWCLLRANHASNKVFFGKDELVVQRGQFVYGRFTASDELKMNPSTIYKILKKLERAGMIEIKSNNKNSLLSIVKYELYQNRDTRGEQQSNNKVTTEEQQSNTNNNVTRINNETKEHTRNEVQERWNSFAMEHGLSTVIKLSEKRRSAVVARLLEDEFDLDRIFAEIKISDFLRGSNGTWKVDFDFVFCSANNYLKILEGKYRNGNSVGNVRKSDATTRATFKHTEQQIKDLADFEESLRQRYPERS